MADSQVDATVLVALQVLPAVSVFLAGFASVRLHAHRDRALARLDRLEVQLRRVVEADEPATDREIDELSREYAQTIQEWPSVAEMNGINWFLLVMVLVLEWFAARRLGWIVDLHVARWNVAFLAFAVLFLTQLSVTVVGLVDIGRVHGQLVGKRDASLWSRIATVVHLLLQQDLEAAGTLADRIVQQAPGAAWAARLRGRVRLEIGRQHHDSEALHDAIAELTRAKNLAAQHRFPEAELKLRSQAQELLGALEYALGDITEALGWNDDDPGLWSRRGDLNVRIAALDEDRGDMDAAAQRYSEARQSYERATRSDWLGVEALLAWIDLELHLGVCQDAKGLVVEALQLQPRNQAVLDMRNRVIAECGPLD